MNLRLKFKSMFNFATAPVTFLTLITYISILTSVVVIHEVPITPPKKPAKQLGLDLDQTWRDLQAITRYPHPYNSHPNDVVRDYILHRVNGIAKKHTDSGIVVADDLTSNGTYAAGQIIYFEGNNILVKIDGKDKNASGGVLFSAHFDSVSTAPGATDNGMSVATLLNLVEYFAKNTPKRTVVFNINNGEEDWLNGAHAFLEHPWAKLSTVFLNLEGAGSAGRPLLFRTSSTGVTKAFKSARHPHGTVLSADAFKARLVRSGTDFTVYETAGLKGLDLAFYRKRSRYHTKYDTVAGLGGQSSLWAMMEASLESGKALIDMDDNQKDGGEAVYFDLFGETLVVMSLTLTFIINIILLAVGPISIGGLSALIFFKKRDHFWTSNGWFRFPIALIVSGGLTTGYARLMAKANPYVSETDDLVFWTWLILITV
ncbi:hypothetical protein FRC02_001820 [Tulasnella sp. 418]|nr:hypothetical protein FRC02_001820 [Tulasnella sp. 418]